MRNIQNEEAKLYKSTLIERKGRKSIIKEIWKTMRSKNRLVDERKI